MKATATSTGSDNLTLAERIERLPKEGLDIGRCYSIIDMGTVEKAFPGKPPKKVRQVQFSFELANQMFTFNPEKGPQPKSIHKTYTMSLHVKASLRKDLQLWRNKKIKDGDEVDFKVFLGQQIGITAVHSEPTPDGKVYANITSVQAKPDEIMNVPVPDAPALINEKVFLDLDEFDAAEFAKLPEWLQGKIAETPEYQAAIRNGGGAPAAAPSEEEQRQHMEAFGGDEDDEAGF